MRLRILHALICLTVWANTVHAEAKGGAGFSKLDVIDPVGQVAMDAVAFYPGSTEAGPTPIGPFVIAASKSVPVASGRYPLILLSHGSQGSMWGNHDLATFLVRQGYVVVSVTHPGDNFRDASRVGSSRAVYGRAMQISAALTAALRDRVLARTSIRTESALLDFQPAAPLDLYWREPSRILHASPPIVPVGLKTTPSVRLRGGSGKVGRNWNRCLTCESAHLSFWHP